MQRIKSFFVFIKTRLATTVRQPINFRLLINRPWKIGLFCLLILLFLGGMAYAGYLSSLPEQRVTEEKPNTVPVEYGDVARSVNAPGQLVGANQVQLSMQVEGRLKQVYVKPGQKVNKGQLLASLSERSRYAAAAGEAEALFQQAQQELDDLINAAPEATAKARLAYVEAQKAFEETQKKRQAMNYPRASQAEINLAQADYYDAITAFEFARDSYDDAAGRSDTDPARIAALRSLSAAGKQRDQALANYNWMKSGYSAYEIEQADANLAKAAAELDKSRIAWERVQDGPDVVLLSLAQSKLVDARVKAETARGAAEHVDLYAPFEGVVLEVNGKAGDPVSATTHLISLTDPTAYEALVTIVEEDFSQIKVGLDVNLFLDAQPETEIKATVSRIVPQRSSGDRAVYPVYLTLPDLPAGVAAGMTVDASILIETREHVLTLPRAQVRSSGGGKAVVEVWTDTGREKRTIQLGLIGDQNVEVLSGLNAGDEVVAR